MKIFILLEHRLKCLPAADGRKVQQTLGNCTSYSQLDLL